ncbi:hypothetical protein BDV95DRAFT_594061 [Massariosphaeria phaeospora]|uniref:Uncharacterized protein n=1 Tax=Massariosphaeria phaeospora TaxID=100035 RepID=A0A7C8IH36_9PLEO|nr:hypothetical protein BDV95DRAFT_594061 [Massariosphaeria phaeospora]
MPDKLTPHRFKYARFNGRFQGPSSGPETHNDDNKSHRQLNAFFNVDEAANSHNGRSLKEERRNKVNSKKQVQEYKQKRKDRKEHKCPSKPSTPPTECRLTAPRGAGGRAGPRGGRGGRGGRVQTHALTLFDIRNTKGTAFVDSQGGVSPTWTL